MTRNHIYSLSELSGGLDFVKILGGATKGEPLPVKVTVDITPKLANTLLGVAGAFAGAIIIASVVRRSK